MTETDGWTAECPDGCGYNTVPAPTFEAIAEQLLLHGIVDHGYHPDELSFATLDGRVHYPRVN